MNFFGKIFLSMMLTMVLFFCFGVFYNIHSSFKYALKREVSSAYEENEILLYTLSNAAESNWYNKASSVGEDGTLNDRWIVGTANSVTIRTSKGVVPFRISDQNFDILYESQWLEIDQGMLKTLPNQTRGYEIILLDEMYYIHVAAPITIRNEQLYIESYRNINDLFVNRDLQYHTSFYLMIIMIVTGGGISFAVSMWLTHPITRLSAATRRFERGDFTQRVNIKGTDELALLAKDFNSMAKRVEQTVEDLKEAAQRQEDFVNNFAHELKTPLTSIIGYADMIRSKKMPPELIVESANYIFGEGKRLESLSMKLMEIIILKHQNLSLQSVDICRLLKSIEGAYRPIFNNSNIEFRVMCEPAIIEIEPDLIKTVCINLLDNARKAIPKEGKILMIGRVTDQGYAISIQDTGIGMSETELTRITEAFYMIDKSRARALGSAGLGLSICSEIIKLHGGSLTFQSAPQVGTCATIHLKGGSSDGKRE